MYHNIEKRSIRTGPHPASEYPYRGYTSRIGTDATFLIRPIINGWGAWGVNNVGENCRGSYLHADTLAELSLLLEQVK